MMTGQQKKKILKEQLSEREKFEIKVENEELYARMNKAAFERMHYYIEASKIREEYEAVVEREQEAIRKQQEAIQKAYEEVSKSFPQQPEPEDTEAG